MKKAVAVGLATLMGAFVANADLVTLDFTSSEYSVLNGETSAMVSDAQGSGLDLTFTATRRNGNTSESLFLTWNATAGQMDGIGIKDDEIGYGELLTIAIDPNVGLQQILITDLFKEGNIEVGYFSVNDGTWTEFKAVVPTAGSNGELTIDVDYKNVSQVAFKTKGTSTLNDFSVRGLVVNTPVSVPEPGTLSLLGLGLGCLIGLAGIRRKK